MKVKIKHIEQAESVPVGEVATGIELEELIMFIKNSGGVYYEGEYQTDISYQFVLDDKEFYVEIFCCVEEDDI